MSIALIIDRLSSGGKKAHSCPLTLPSRLAATIVAIAAYENCPVTGVLRRIGDKWSPAVIRLLAEHGCGFNELDRSIEGISRRMLTRTLRGLEEAGFVSRTTSGPPPARVEYSLAELGHSLREQLFALGRWADAHRSDLP